MKELWQPVPGYEGLYEVSDLGRVRSLDRVVAHGARTLSLRGKPLRTKHSGAGYPSVVLSKDGKTKTRYVHHLVAFAFLGSRPKGMDINHKDCDKENNALNNLEYISHGENQRHAVRMGRMANDNWTRRERNELGQFNSAKACPQPHVAA